MKEDMFAYNPEENLPPDDTAQQKQEDIIESGVRDKSEFTISGRGNVPIKDDIKISSHYALNEIPEGFELSQTPEWEISARGTIKTEGDENRAPFKQSFIERDDDKRNAA